VEFQQVPDGLLDGIVSVMVQVFRNEFVNQLKLSFRNLKAYLFHLSSPQLVFS